MSPDTDVHTTIDSLAPARNEAFRKLGRNIALFQRLEQGLKTLFSMLTIEGSTEQSLARSTRKRRKHVSGKSLGQVACHVLGELSSAHDDAPLPLPIGAEVALRTSLRIEGDEYLALKQTTLSGLVRERNRLVHHLAEDYDLHDSIGIGRLDALLDPQAERIRTELRWLDETLADFRACLEAAHAALAHPDAQGGLPET